MLDIKCFDLAKILLPKQEIDLEKWAVIACDQYTSQPEYWEQVKKEVGDTPSTLKLILPEVYIEDNKDYLQNIHKNMKEYQEQGILENTDEKRLILVERITESGIRLGIIGQIDLEQYDYSKGNNAFIRATEETVVSRIPPRIEIRRNACLELPHIMLLYDDNEQQIIEPLYEKVKSRSTIYDFELMLGGGRIKGYEIAGEEALEITELFEKKKEQSKGLLFAVGDGNHSLATAKACWNEIRSGLTASERENHPARYALVEVVNLFDSSMQFEPIHRVLFHAELEDFIDYLKTELEKQEIVLSEGKDIVFISKNKSYGFSMENYGNKLMIDILQKVIDSYISQNFKVDVDYIHGEDNLRKIIDENNCFGILMPAIEKEMIFEMIRNNGTLPRKTFSIGHAHEKRYYLECRSLL